MSAFNGWYAILLFVGGLVAMAIWYTACEYKIWWFKNGA